MDAAVYNIEVLYSKGTKNYLWKLNEFTKMFDDQEMRTRINYFILTAIQPYVPKQSGELRKSYKVRPDRITWGEGLDYAHYQHEGVVWAPNYPIMSGGKIVGWYSPPGEGTKHPTDRELGVPGSWRGWNFGYTTPNTQHHWTEVYKGALKNETNKKITAYLKSECKMRGLDV